MGVQGARLYVHRNNMLNLYWRCWHLRTYLVRWYGLQERFPRFMDHEQREEYYNAAAGFIRRYVSLARQAARRLGYKPKSLFVS